MTVSHPPEKNAARDASATVGFFLWRAGLAFCACYLAYRGFSKVITALLEVGVPAQVVWGVAFFAFGSLLLIVSLVVERIIDARAEGSLKDS